MKAKKILVILIAVLMIATVFAGCAPKQKPSEGGGQKPAETKIKIGLVTDVGGRGDRSFNDSALRGLEMWAAKVKYVKGGGYQILSDADYEASIPDDLKDKPIFPLYIKPVVLESKAKEDYVPNLTTLAEQEHCDLVIGVGFMLAGAVGEVAAKHPNTKFMLIDALPVDSQGKVVNLPNVVSYLFKENQCGFLVGAIAGYATKTNKIGYIGGMKIPPVLRYQAGFEAGVKTTNPKAKIISQYAGSFTEPAKGKASAESMIAQGADVLFHAAGATGNGMFQALCEKNDPNLWGIGVDVDMGKDPNLCPDRTLTSALKHVDYATYLAIKSVVDGTFKGGVITMSLKDGGVGYAPDHVKDVLSADQIKKVNELAKEIAEGKIVVPEDPSQVKDWVAPTALLKGKVIKIGLVTDVGGRGDRSFNDSALRGLEMWAAKVKYVKGGGYQILSDADYEASIPDDLKDKPIFPLYIKPVVLESKAKEDYVPNLTTLAEQEHCDLVIGVGFMLAGAVGEVAAKHPNTKFMLIDALPVDSQGKVVNLPNVVSYLFKENQCGFLVGAIAGYATKTNKIGYIGGMKIPPVLRYQAGFEAGVKTTNPKAKIISQYAGSFTEPAKGKASAESMIAQGADVLFHAAGATGNGMFQALCEKNDPNLWGIGVDVDMGKDPNLCPDRTLTSALKHVDYATYLAIKSVVDGTFKGGVITMSLKDGGVGYAPDHVKDVLSADQIKKVNELANLIKEGKVVVPEDPSKVGSWTPPSDF